MRLLIFVIVTAATASVALAQAADAVLAPEGSGGSASSAPLTDPKSLSEPPRYVTGTMPYSLPISRDLAAQGRYGVVRAVATVTAEGALQDISLAEPAGIADLDAAIVEALGTWKLSPARDLGGAKVAARSSFPFEIGAMPERQSGSEPVFTDEAKAAGHNGTVRASATIGIDGAVTGVTVTQGSGSDILDKAVVDALPSWRFAAPRNLKGEPAQLPLNVKFGFS